MPIYEYVCQDCGHRLEALQKISDEPLSECPQCGKPALKKMISAAGFRLKGGGWYESDFKTGKKKYGQGDGDKAAPKSDGGDKKDSGGTSSSSSSTSPAGANP